MPESFILPALGFGASLAASLLSKPSVPKAPSPAPTPAAPAPAPVPAAPTAPAPEPTISPDTAIAQDQAAQQRRKRAAADLTQLDPNATTDPNASLGLKTLLGG